MSCNCKNKKGTTSSKTKTPEPSPIVVQQSQPTTLEEVMMIENMLPDINSNAEKRAVITEFVKIHFGEVIMSYCDVICQRRIKDRIQELKATLK